MSTDLLPVGVLSILHLERMLAGRHVRLRRSEVGSGDTGLVAAYLRGGTVLVTAMEHTGELLDGRFEPPGGSAIQTEAGCEVWGNDG